MDNNIFQNVYDFLDSSTDEIQKTLKQRDEIDSEIKNGTYTHEALEKRIYPQREKLDIAVRGACNTALEKAREMVNQYSEDVERHYDLNPDDITDDVKLLNAGVTLTSRDIDALIRRNSGNSTMIQIILRYANEHGIKTANVFIGGQAERKAVRDLEEIIKYYGKWIDKPNGKAMLQRFFDAVRS